MQHNGTGNSLKEILKNTNWDSLSNNDIIQYVMEFATYAPEVKAEIMEKYPDFAEALKRGYTEFTDVFKAILGDDTETIRRYIGIVDKELDNTSESRRLFYNIAENMQAANSKLLENPDISDERIKFIMENNIDILKMVADHDDKNRNHEKELEEKVYKKDSEKRMFHWQIFGTVLATLAGIAIGKIEPEKLKSVLEKK